MVNRTRIDVNLGSENFHLYPNLKNNNIKLNKTPVTLRHTYPECKTGAERLGVIMTRRITIKLGTIIETGRTYKG